MINPLNYIGRECELVTESGHKVYQIIDLTVFGDVSDRSVLMIVESSIGDVVSYKVAGRLPVHVKLKPARRYKTLKELTDEGCTLGKSGSAGSFGSAYIWHPSGNRMSAMEHVYGLINPNHKYAGRSDDRFTTTKPLEKK